MEANDPQPETAGRPEGQAAGRPDSARAGGALGAAPPPPPPPSRPPSPARPSRRGSLWAVVAVLLVLGVFALLGLALLSSILGGDATLTMVGRGPVALIRIEGIIEDGPDFTAWMEALRRAETDPRILGVVVRIDSPGGAVGSSQELYDAIDRLRRVKPVFVSMSNVAASGGYYCAAAADRIFALGGTLTGSIGVMFAMPELSELARRLGIAQETIVSGRYKDAGSFMRPMRDDERELFNRLIGDTYDQFLQHILARRAAAIESACRAIPADEWAAMLLAPVQGTGARAYLEPIADGRVLTGRQALRLGLIDELGTLEDAIRAMGARLNLTGRPAVVELKTRRSWLERLTESASRLMPVARAPLQYRMLLP